MSPNPSTSEKRLVAGDSVDTIDTYIVSHTVRGNVQHSDILTSGLLQQSYATTNKTYGLCVKEKSWNSR